MPIHSEAVEASSEAPPVKIELIYDQAAIQANTPFWVGIRLQHQPGWHSYWKNPGDAGLATEFEWTLPATLKAGSIEWPVPQKFNLNSIIGLGYEGEILLLTQMTPTKEFVEGPLELKADIHWLACSDATCVPGDATVVLEIPQTPSPSQKNAEMKQEILAAIAKLPSQHHQINAVRKDGLIVIHLTGIDQGITPTPSFFPETTEQVDLQKEPMITAAGQQAGEYLITMAEGASFSDRLKGILLLEDPKTDNPLALNIDLLIHKDANALEVDAKDLNHAVILGSKASTANASAAQFDGGLGLALLLAFVGGMILNLMPCVLPVISFKVLSFVKMAGQSRSLTLKHGLMFSLGVLVSFWTLAVAMLILQVYGKSVGWGFQLQEPLFVITLATGLMIFALSLFGIFEFGTFFASLAGNASVNKPNQEGFSGSFFSGVLATAVATPCTGPFLGSAIGFAVTLPPFYALLIFTSLGMGMAFPYLVLSLFPSLLSFLPKPGNWMVTFKELMGFVMMTTVLWLLWVFAAQTSSLALLIVLFAFLLITLGFWVYGRFGTLINKRRTRLLSSVFALLCLTMASYTIYVSASLPPETTQVADAGDWEPFSATRVAELQKQGVPVFIDFTAKWCLICQTNHMVLASERVGQKFKELGVVKMSADWTSNDEEITKALRQFGRNGVPLYLLYNGKESPEILPQVLTPDVVIEHLETMLKDAFEGSSLVENE
ncbi:MAG: hypothetical protein CK425_03515 [Parachlamydia sp.]|nr:MAG: hypothetical protein CK425_03515 [Parachlamydia sp.]